MASRLGSAHLVRQVMELYPRVFFACHRRHVPDPRARRTLTAHQASILDHLDPQETLSLTELAQHMGVKPSAMSLAVERLVRWRYVLRSRDASDRRRVCLRLSAAGERIKKASSVLDARRVASMLGRLSPRDREQAVHGLALLAGAAHEMMRGHAAGGGARQGR